MACRWGEKNQYSQKSKGKDIDQCLDLEYCYVLGYRWMKVTKCILCTYQTQLSHDNYILLTSVFKQSFLVSTCAVLPKLVVVFWRNDGIKALYSPKHYFYSDTFCVRSSLLKPMLLQSQYMIWYLCYYSYSIQNSVTEKSAPDITESRKPR